jgi:hypothetical protein
MDTHACGLFGKITPKYGNLLRPQGSNTNEHGFPQNPVKPRELITSCRILYLRLHNLWKSFRNMRYEIDTHAAQNPKRCVHCSYEGLELHTELNDACDEFTPPHTPTHPQHTHTHTHGYIVTTHNSRDL